MTHDLTAYVTCDGCSGDRSFRYSSEPEQLRMEGNTPWCCDCFCGYGEDAPGTVEKWMGLPELDLDKCADRYINIKCTFCEDTVYPPDMIFLMPDGRQICEMCEDNSIHIDALDEVSRYDEGADEYYFEVDGHRVERLTEFTQPTIEQVREFNRGNENDHS